ncbi:lysosome-associated membrane glycoprotein 1 [Eurytemora carolleeae]|uniref:lysosome-associated membrane glycoprotein 1 n=1 Tax=Eurytemora carolleeae TaxID=1294199 RepID=UPI000C76DA1D|nr:lysosome-associated membrane glycoprotein 1 [Eurytemora carolleeae]|eukprot:XP_023340063.1 lysosome-associated membrane glycoprotein 1-like [Eurytemora affinis]
MAPLKCLMLVVLGACGAVGLDAPDKGNWTVENCIVLKMAAQLTILPVEKNENISVTVDIPVSALAAGSCKDNQTIELSWEEEDKKKRVLKRSFKISFARNDTANPPVYGVRRLDGVYDYKYFTKNVSENSSVEAKHVVVFSTYNLDRLEFNTPINRSYLCLDVGNVEMKSAMKDSTEPIHTSGDELLPVTFTAKNVQLDAFRSTDVEPDQLQTPLDCSFRPSDVVPIVVGCALAGTVLLVLIAYLVGRRRNRARGYQSV